MTTWSLDQIRQVRSVRAQGVVDLAYPDMDAAASGLRKKLARGIIDMCHPFGVEVHPGDIDFRETIEAMHRKIAARWMPSTKQVELIGGHDDGRTYEFQGAPNESLRVAVVPSVLLADFAAPSPSTERIATSLVYSLSGWRESERHWVYSTKDRA